jgi:replicative DNA helicase
MTLGLDDPDTYTGPPPHLAPVDDEIAVLGSCLLSPDATDRCAAVIPSGAVFWRPAHAEIWDAIHRLWERGIRADPLTVSAELGSAIGPVGGPAYLHTLIASVPTAANAEFYLRRVLNAWQLRAGETALVRGRQAIASPDAGPAAAILDAVAADIETASELHTRARTAVPVGSLIGDVLAGLTVEPWDDDAGGVPWPYRDLGGPQAPMNPMMPGQMIGAGKSTVLKDCCEHCSFDMGWPSLLVSYEMKAREITARVLSHQARVPLAHLTRPGLINAEDRARVEDYRAALEDAQMFIVDSEDTSIGELDRLIRQYRPRLVAIDYLQLAVPDGPDNERRHRVERFSRDVKKLAGRREVPILVGSQLNRELANRRDKRPRLEDLRESGAIENDCDAVILFHREDMYEPEGPRVGEVDAIVAKQRNGPTDTITLANRLHFASFADMAR